MKLDIIRSVANRLRYGYATVEVIIKTYLNMVDEYKVDKCTCNETKVIRYTYKGFICAKCGKLKL